MDMRIIAKIIAVSILFFAFGVCQAQTQWVIPNTTKVEKGFERVDSVLIVPQSKTNADTLRKVTDTLTQIRVISGKLKYWWHGMWRLTGGGGISTVNTIAPILGNGSSGSPVSADTGFHPHALATYSEHQRDSILASSKQSALNGGTGFVKSTSGAISYDNSTYLTTSGNGSSLTGVTHPSDTIKFWTNYKQYQRDSLVQDPTGFDNPANVIINYNSINRTITLTGSPWKAYWQGKQITALVSGWTSSAHTATSGAWYLYYNGTSFIWSQTTWSFNMLQIAYVNYNKWAQRECHSFMPTYVHKELHETQGTYLSSGGDISNVVTGSTTAANRRPFVSAATVNDEDLPTVNPALTTNSYTTLRLYGSGTNIYNTAQVEIDSVPAGRPYYNQYTGSTWVQTLMTGNSYTDCWVIAVPVTSDAGSQAYRYIFVEGQYNSTTLSTIQALNPSNVNLGTLVGDSPEFVFIARIIIHYIGTTNWEITQVDKISGNKYTQTSSSGSFLSAVTTSYPITGTGTTISPVGIDTAFFLKRPSVTTTTPDTVLVVDRNGKDVKKAAITSIPYGSYSQGLGSGTAYTLTNSNALLHQGTSDPTVTLTISGTYKITAVVYVEYAAATITTQTLTLNIYRQNNTPVVLQASPAFRLDPVTTTTKDVCYTLFTFYYTTTATTDVIQLWGQLSAGPSAGNMTVIGSQITAELIYNQ
jgi:hypothetical protein